MSKKDILFLHPALGCSYQFSSLKSLLKNKFNIYTLDFEGHGTSSNCERPFRIEHFAENIITYLDQNSLEKIDIFGYSMGGYVALYLATQQPQRIGSIFTMATKFAWSPESAAKENKFLDADKIINKVPQFAKMLEQYHGDKWRIVLQKTAEMMNYLGANNILTKNNFEQIEHKVRIGIGDKDNMVSLEESIEVYRLLAKGELEVFPGTLHPIEKVSYTRLASSILDFYNKV